MNKLILVDGDILTYRCAFAEKDKPADEAFLKMEELLSNIWEEVDPYGYSSNRKIFLTGSGNYRHDIAKTAVYKGNRKDTPKPEHLQGLRNYLILQHNAIVVDGAEADDAIATWATQAGVGNFVIVSTDKDFNQVPGTIFNPGKWQWQETDTWTATKNFYLQVLTGDTVDNIIGIYGIGPAKANKLILGCDSEKALFNACVEAYINLAKLPSDVAYARVVENGQLLWLQREKHQIWEPPV